MTRFLIVGDLHGKIPHILKQEFDAIIAPGDFCSDWLRRIFFDETIEENWWEYLGKTRAKKEVQKSLADGRKVLERLNRVGVPVFLVPGNWDWTAQEDHPWSFLRKDHYGKLLKGLHNLVDVYHGVAFWKDVGIFGHGITSGPEFPPRQHEKALYTKTELRLLKTTHTQLVKALGLLCKSAKKEKRTTIFISHNVPYNTKVDKILNPRSPLVGRHYGSTIARDVVKKYSPTACIGGHMHEHFGITTLAGTPVINAGFGPAVNVVLDVEQQRIQHVAFYRNGRKVKPRHWTNSVLS